MAEFGVRLSFVIVPDEHESVKPTSRYGLRRVDPGDYHNPTKGFNWTRHTLASSLTPLLLRSLCSTVLMAQN